MDTSSKQPAANLQIPDGAEMITLGAGCFWCIEAAYNQLEGVYSAISGYMGGSLENPTYRDICTGQSGHAEVVRVVFNPQTISYEKILAWFWELHDATQLNRQGNDVGTQYRSAIFYGNEAQKSIAEASRAAAKAHFDQPIVTEITPAETFYPAEDYHQEYYFQNKGNNGYCQFVVEPKLRKLNLKY